jgi:iron complex outermembrane recepter protein
MTMKVRGGASALALLIGLSGFSAATAQEPGPQTTPETVPAAEEDCDPERPGVQTGTACAVDRVVVTGSNIAGAVESAALPVEVYTAEDNLKSGNQTTMDFIKTLSVVGSTIGETNQFQAGYGGIGSATLNLRGLGGGRTLTIFNGRRFSENTNMIPSIALSRTEILKDGGAVIYGADATGGVVNFITRDNFDGLILQGDFRGVEGSKGDWSGAMLWGHQFDQSNLLFSAEYSHRSELPITKRDWAVREYAENQTPWAPYHNYGTYLLKTATGTDLGVVQDFTTAQCQGSTGPVQGQVIPISGLPTCWWNYAIHTYNLVEEIDQLRLYGQFTADLDNSTRFSAQLSYGKSDANNIGTVAAYQANVGPAPSSGTAFQYRVPVTNPYFTSFLDQNNVSAAIRPLIHHADQFLSIMFGPSGNPAWGPGEGTTPTTQLENWNAVAAFDGEWGDWAGDWLDTWKMSMTYNLGTSDNTLPDIVGYKVQQALNGFGGPNCNAPDLVPDNWNLVADTDGNGAVSAAENRAFTEAFYASIGTQNPAAAGKNGCLYLNPFASSYAANGTFGTPNPRYVPGNEVPAELAAWFYDERHEETVRNDLVIDALTSGGTPLNLPGGMVAWAAGAQWRQQETRDEVQGEFLDPGEMPCQWPGQEPGQVGCPPTGESPYWFFGQNNPNKSEQQQYSYFGELQVPVLDNLGLQLAIRREEFPRSGLGATVYKVAGKWDPFDWLAVRGSFGTNYATPPDITPGDIRSSLSLIANAGNKYLRVQTEDLAGLKPETAEVMNFGLIFNFDNLPVLNGSFRLSLDYFNFEIKDEIKTVSHNQILNTVFMDTNVPPDGIPNPGSNNFINCSAALIERISFINGVGAAGCAQNVTRGQDVTSIRSVRGNGPGATTSGVDVDASYSFDALGGEITASFQGTNVLEYEIAAFELNGVTLSPKVDGLGFANYSRDGDIISEWRTNTTLNYEIGDHNLRYVYRFIQGVKDDRFLGTAFEEIDGFATHNLYYQYTLPWGEDFTASLAIDNLTDEEPPFTQQQYSYDPFIGNALGRTIKIGIRKQF